MSDIHHKLLQATFEVAHNSRKNGNHPFGALLVDPNGEILIRAENTVITSQDITAHAEINLIRKATAKYNPDFLARCTLYTSTEPCPMCAGAIFWANIRRVVYGLSERGLYNFIAGKSREELALPCRELFDRGKKPIEVVGPLLEEEAREPHLGFWE